MIHEEQELDQVLEKSGVVRFDELFVFGPGLDFLANQLRLHIFMKVLADVRAPGGPNEIKLFGEAQEAVASVDVGVISHIFAECLHLLNNSFFFPNQRLVYLFD